jgi:hypothetical protein
MKRLLIILSIVICCTLAHDHSHHGHDHDHHGHSHDEPPSFKYTKQANEEVKQQQHNHAHQHHAGCGHSHDHPEPPKAKLSSAPEPGLCYFFRYHFKTINVISLLLSFQKPSTYGFIL